MTNKNRTIKPSAKGVKKKTSRMCLYNNGRLIRMVCVTTLNGFVIGWRNPHI